MYLRFIAEIFQEEKYRRNVQARIDVRIKMTPTLIKHLRTILRTIIRRTLSTYAYLNNCYVVKSAEQYAINGISRSTTFLFLVNVMTFAVYVSLLRFFLLFFVSPRMCENRLLR